jgi:predicted transcriptional regulator
MTGNDLGLEVVLALKSCLGQFPFMTDKQLVMQALRRLPEDVSLKEITEEIRIMAAIRRGREDVAAQRVKTHEEVAQLLESWSSQWTSK